LLTFLFLHQFGEDPVAGFGVDEGDPPAVGTGAGGFIDQANATFLEIGKGGGNVIDGIGDMVDAFAAFRHEASDRALRIGWLDQFQVAVAGVVDDRDDPLCGNVQPLAVRDARRA
jgi:hypothetical protein